MAPAGLERRSGKNADVKGLYNDRMFMLFFAVSKK